MKWATVRVRAQRGAALSLAGAVFLSSPFMNLPLDSRVVGLPVVRQLVAFNKALDLDQRWVMFAPPARTVSGLGAAFQLPGGWTDVVSIGLEIDLASRERLTAVRGQARLHTFFRAHAFFDRDDGHMPTVRRYYFASLGAYFCEGRARIEGLHRVRFYHLVRNIPPFREAIRDPTYTLRPLTSEDVDAQVPIYEYGCGD